MEYYYSQQLLLQLMTSKICVWCVKGIFRCQGHINPMPSHPPVLNKSLGNFLARVMRVLSPVGEWYECILPILDHVRIHTFCEGINKFVEVAQNGVAEKPLHD